MTTTRLQLRAVRPAYRWLDPLGHAAVRDSARRRSAHAGACNWDLKMLRGAVGNLSRLAHKYALPAGFTDALGRIESVIEQRVVELRARGPVEVAHRSTTPQETPVP